MNFFGARRRSEFLRVLFDGARRKADNVFEEFEAAMSSNVTILSVSRFAEITNNCLKNLGKAYIEGEISALNLRTHLYFTIKDEISSIDCVMFKSALSRIAFTPQIGQKVVISGNSSIWVKTGRFNFLVDSMSIAGIGSIMERLRLLKEKLEKEGVFDQHHRRLPLFPNRVGVITSKDGQVVHDIATTLSRRNRGIEIRVYDALVQGEGAAQSLIDALTFANAENCCDVLIIGRGGGSDEDLLPFSDEALTRAVACSKIPIVSAVGHERNYALTDFAADVRAATPTAAAELISAVSTDDLKVAIKGYMTRLEDALMRTIDPYGICYDKLKARLIYCDPARKLLLQAQRLQNLINRGSIALDKLLNDYKFHLSELNARVSACDPLTLIHEEKAYLSDLIHRLSMDAISICENRANYLSMLITRFNNCGIEEKLAALKERLASDNASLIALNPLSVLERGYSVTLNNKGHHIVFSQVNVGDTITTLLDGGKIVSMVTKKNGADDAD